MIAETQFSRELMPQFAFYWGDTAGHAISSFPDDLRVGVVASGGLSHFVVDEELDRQFLDALIAGDRAFLAGLDDDVLRSGTSELRSWIVAGTGCAMAFATWSGAE